MTLRSTRLLRLALVLPMVFGCSGRPAAGDATHASLGGDTVARVGGLDVAGSTVLAVAAERGVSPDEALALLVDDAVAAKGALARGMNRAPNVLLETSAARARSTIARARGEATRSQPNDDEVRALSATHWLDVDRPETMVVIHAIAVRPKKPDAVAEAAAKGVAAAIAAAVAGASDAADFEARARAVPTSGAQVEVERLDPFTADGRVASAAGGMLDGGFVAGAAALQAAGSTTGVVESSFGWHVIRLIERLPPRIVPFEERRRAFADEVYALRTRDGLGKVLAAARAREPVVVANGIDDLLAQAIPALPGTPSEAPRAP